MAKFTALELTQLLDRLVDHLINNSSLFDSTTAEEIREHIRDDVRLLREAAARCDEYADELERGLQANEEAK